MPKDLPRERARSTRRLPADAERRLIVEVDGSQHADSRRDAAGDARLEGRGFTVMRFWTDEVLANPIGVQYAIAEKLGLGWIP